MFGHIELLDVVVQEATPWYWIGGALSIVTGLAFAAIGVMLLAAVRGRRNPLSLATAMIFLTCGGGHLLHAAQLAYPWIGLETVGEAARVHYLDWHLWVADGLTAVAGLFYWSQRSRFHGMVEGAAMYEDLRTRRQEALHLNDDVVQELNTALLALDANDPAEAAKRLRMAREALDD